MRTMKDCARWVFALLLSAALVWSYLNLAERSKVKGAEVKKLERIKVSGLEKTEWIDFVKPLDRGVRFGQGYIETVEYSKTADARIKSLGTSGVELIQTHEVVLRELIELFKTQEKEVNELREEVAKLKLARDSKSAQNKIHFVATPAARYGVILSTGLLGVNPAMFGLYDFAEGKLCALEEVVIPPAAP